MNVRAFIFFQGSKRVCVSSPVAAVQKACFAAKRCMLTDGGEELRLLGTGLEAFR